MDHLEQIKRKLEITKSFGNELGVTMGQIEWMVETIEDLRQQVDLAEQDVLDLMVERNNLRGNNVVP